MSTIERILSLFVSRTDGERESDKVAIAFGRPTFVVQYVLEFVYFLLTHTMCSIFVRIPTFNTNTLFQTKNVSIIHDRHVYAVCAVKYVGELCQMLLKGQKNISHVNLLSSSAKVALLIT